MPLCNIHYKSAAVFVKRLFYDSMELFQRTEIVRCIKLTDCVKNALCGFLTFHLIFSLHRQIII